MKKQEGYEKILEVIDIWIERYSIRAEESDRYDKKYSEYDILSNKVDILFDVKNIIMGYMNAGWIPVEERLPEEKINPVTGDWYKYPVTVEIVGRRDVRYYVFGKGHWWNGPECMDKYVIAWMDVTEPYKRR